MLGVDTWAARFYTTLYPVEPSEKESFSSEIEESSGALEVMQVEVHSLWNLKALSLVSMVRGTICILAVFVHVFHHDKRALSPRSSPSMLCLEPSHFAQTVLRCSNKQICLQSMISSACSASLPSITTAN